jgi:hypothetical protein
MTAHRLPILRRRTCAVALAVAAAAALAAPAQTVYRCGPDGRQYSQTPCADGRPVTVEDSRSAEQQRAAKDVAARDSKQAEKLADERRQRDEAAKGQVAVGIKPAQDAAAASAPKRKAKAQTQAAESNMSPPMRAAPSPAKTQ